MNKNELLEELKHRKYGCLPDQWAAGFDAGLDKSISLIKKLDEQTKPAPVEVPECVAEWIEQCKSNATLAECLNGFYLTNNDKIYCKDTVESWMSDDDNDLLLARAWLDGYTVAKEPLYVVVIGDLYLREPMSGDSNYVEMTWDLEYAYEFSLNTAEEHASKFGGEIVPVEEESQ